MAIKATHELHKRRLSRNVGVAGALLAFAALMFGVFVSTVLTLLVIPLGCVSASDSLRGIAAARDAEAAA